MVSQIREEIGKYRNAVGEYYASFDASAATTDQVYIDIQKYADWGRDLAEKVRDDEVLRMNLTQSFEALEESLTNVEAMDIIKNLSRATNYATIAYWKIMQTSR